MVEETLNISIILAHPQPESFNHAIAQAATRACLDLGHHVAAHDLYAEGFDPLLPGGEIPSEAHLPPPIQQHCDEIAAADGIVIVHPNWWGMPPAILKGWVDRVIRPGVAYQFAEGDGGEGVPIGLLRARAALVFNTCNTLRERELRVFGDPLETLWRGCIFDLCGVKVVHRRTFGVMVTSAPEQRQAWLAQVKAAVHRVFGDGPSIHIRRYEPADHDAVWALHNLALNRVNAHGGNGAWDNDLYHVGEVYLGGGGEFLVGVLQGRIVAMGALRRADAECAEIKRMRVHPDVQRRGYGSAILHALEARAVELGYRTLSLDTTTRQTAAHAFYRRHGYRDIGRDRYAEFELILYQKSLS